MILGGLNLILLLVFWNAFGDINNMAYCKYYTTAASTVADIMHDIVLVLTGTTSVGSLSAHVDSVNTFLSAAYTSAGLTLVDPCASSLSTVTFSNVGGNLTMNKGTTSNLQPGMPITIHGGTAPTGLVDNTTYYVCTTGLTTTACTWATTYANAMAGTPIAYTDAGAGTKVGWCGLSQVLSMPVYDGGATGTDVNYIQLVGAAGSVYPLGWESWNSTTHAGTNNTNVNALGTTSGAIFTIGTATAFSIYANGYSCAVTGNNTYVGFISQKVRASAWDTAAAGYPTVASFSPNSPYSNLGGAARTLGGTSINYGVSIAYNSNAYYPNVKISDGGAGSYAPLNDIVIGQNSVVALSSISALSDIWGSITYPLPYDEIFVGGKSYVFLQGSAFAAIPGICVPKG
jgi:hypothetical protein